MKKIPFLLVMIAIALPACFLFEDNKCPNPIEFDLPLEVYGQKDTLSLGDTLRIKLEIPDRLAERNSNGMYEFIDYDFLLITYFDKIDTLPLGLGTIEYFDWATTVGESKYENNVYSVVPSFDNHTYRYEVLITPKRKGLFVFGMNSISSRLHPLEKPEGPCCRYTVHVYPKLVNETNVNFEFLQNSSEPIIANIDRKRFDEFAGFCFYVKWGIGAAPLDGYARSIYEVLTGNRIELDIPDPRNSIRPRSNNGKNPVVQSTFTIYPNPSGEGYVNIDIAGIEMSSTVYRIYDIYGRLIASDLIKKGSNKVEIDNWSEGIYIIAIVNEEGTLLHACKVLITH